jgi:predicted transposase YbfD/YdcC
LIDILFVAVCGVLAGADSFASIHEFAIDRRHWFVHYLDLSHGIPSDDTLAHALARLDPGAFEKCLLGWIRAVQEATEDRLIAIDGKTLRCSYDRADGRAAIPMVSAWATENKLSLGQVVVHDKSNEITAIPESLAMLYVAGALVTLDAMGCQRGIAASVRCGEGDYVLAVKHNKPTLYGRVEAAIDLASEEETGGFEEHVTSEKGHGRQETRIYAIMPAPGPIDPEGQCCDLKAIAIATSERIDGRGHHSLESRYYI